MSPNSINDHPNNHNQTNPQPPLQNNWGGAIVYNDACLIEPRTTAAAVSGLVSMARGLDGTIDSRFFVTIPEDARWADGRYSAFGRVSQTDDSMAVRSRSQLLGPRF